MNKYIESIFEKKRQRRRKLSVLTFEKKIEIIVKIQRAVDKIKMDSKYKPWPF